MLVLTLTDQDNDDLEGVFDNLAQIRRWINDQNDREFVDPLTTFRKVRQETDAEIKKQGYSRTRKRGLRLTHESVGYLDNGYGGRYYHVWEVER